MSFWFDTAVFYHMYPLGLTGADCTGSSRDTVSRMEYLYPWIDHLSEMGFNALYIGPLFESSTHGYDTRDYFKVDSRLGTNELFAAFIDRCHAKNIRVIVDAVFNHVGREFFAFTDLQHNGWHSLYRDWFITDFNRRSCYNDNFWYEGWNGHYNLVKLKLSNHHVKEHIKKAVSFWIKEFDIDGLRLDAADAMDKMFFNELHSYSKNIRNDFYLLGEVIHGNYREWANDERLDSVTNYECYKGLWSSHNDKNYFELAHSLDRQYGTHGIYKGIKLYNFADNHDVSRIISSLTEKAHLYPLYIALFTIPGIPSVYYGSEWGIEGKKIQGTDAPLRPALDISLMNNGDTTLKKIVKRLIHLRKGMLSLLHGEYKTLLIQSQQFAFLREYGSDAAIVALNAENSTVMLNIMVHSGDGTVFTDRLNDNQDYIVKNGILTVRLFPNWGCILEKK
ncbi:MAG: alpha-amylase family glycosyl hydrolase [Fibrobacterota bacterium]